MAIALLGVCACAIAAPASAQPPVATPTLLDQARAIGLAESLGWLRLLQYRPSPLGGVTSEVDGAEFFLAANGKHDPEAELEATLLAFELPLREGNEGAHALCRFPARRLWLDERLHFGASLHAPRCPALDRFLAALDPRAIAVVYSAPYLGHAESAFGHTFLRIRKRRPAGTTTPAEKLDHGVDYVAIPDTRNPLLYVFKGLTGLFPGVAAFHTYEEKVREYGGFEERDLWEYDLALTPEEVNLYALHLFEVTEAHVDFYYLRKNCSYSVLASLEAAAPRIDLISRLDAVVVPVDTIRALARVPGLVRKISYRPSFESNLRLNTARLTPPERAMAERLVADPEAPLPADFTPLETAAALDAASVVLDARVTASKVPDPTLEAKRASLAQRAAGLGPLPPPPPTPAPFDKEPHRAHGSMRFTLGDGVTTQYGTDFLAIGYRLVLHDLTDPPNGSPELSLVELLDTQLRYDVVRKSLTVDRLTFAEVMSLNPLTAFEKQVSWKAEAFGMRLHDSACPDCFAHGLDGGLGATVATEDQHVALFLMAESYIAFSGTLDGIRGSFVRVGVGPFGGVRMRLPGPVVGLVTGSWSYLPGETLRSTFDLRASLRFALATDVALGVEGAVQPLSAEGVVSSYLYF